jgi:RNA-directed DNA polymerase
VGRWAFDETSARAAELKGKLGAMTAQATTALDVAAIADAGVVNGPEDLDWDAIGWSRAENEVRRLRQRIFKASQAGDLARVRSLQRLLLRSRAGTLISVRQVTGRNAGRATAGVDGEVALTSRARAKLAVGLHRGAKPGQPLPVLRVYIPKKGKKGGRRPLGIPVIADRVQQNRVRNALEPEWEARFEARSYGFRPGRGCHDAIAAIYTTLKGDRCQRLWVADCDLSSAFDKINHTWLLEQLGSFPAREQIRGWLKAGVIEKGRYAPAGEGTPQGGVISPLLLNIALHGMEQAAGVRYYKNGRTAPGSPVLVRYAGDYVALCRSRQQAELVVARLREWLAPRGLSINDGKSQIVHLPDGFGFLGFNIRRYPTRRGGKLLIKPSKDAITRTRRRLTAEIRSLRGGNPAAIIGRLNPITRGWAAYYRTGVSSATFSKLDHHLWQRLWWWARRAHPKKPKRWAAARHFGKFHPGREDKWVFGDAASGAHLHKHSWTPIVRHVLVTGTSSPDDPALTQYWADRRRKRQPPLGDGTLVLLKKQHGRCPACGDFLLHADTEPDSPRQWEQWFRATRKAITCQVLTTESRGRARDHPRLIHAHCAPRQPAGPAASPASRRTTCTPSRPA